jgi:hypothetical protein
VVKLLDFGLAKIVATAPGTDELESVTLVVHGPGGATGTPQYMAPEQAEGRVVDRRSDIWAIGVLIYEMLTGRRPFVGAGPITLPSITAALASLPKRVQPDLTPLLARALASDPDDRYHDIADLAADLERARAGLRAPRSRPFTAPLSTAAPVDRRPSSTARSEERPAPKQVAAVPAPPDGAAAGAADTSPGGAPDIDLSAADALIDIRNRQRLLREYRTRAQQVKDVDEAVARKVLADYEARHEDMERKAAPFIRSVRAAYQRLAGAVERIRRMDDEARLLAAEASLRHAVGEIDDAELAERVRQPNGVRARCASERQSLAAIEARLVEALDIPAGTDAAAVLDAPDAETARLSSPSPDQFERSVAQGDVRDDLTLILPDASLLLHGGAEPTTFRLAAITYIGRAEDNQVRLVSPRVSQRHALIVAEPHGYVVKDCDSETGTFVNGARVTTSNLSDGDRVRVGDFELVFRMRSVPAPGR